jgi:Zn finger protein HypA/HybF involved in hydrogenase expression
LLYIGRHNLSIKPISKLTGRNNPVKFKCLDCRLIFYKASKALENLVNKNQRVCPKCNVEDQRLRISTTLKIKHAKGEIATNRKFTPLQYANYLKPNKVKPLEDYINMDTSIEHQCLVCNYTFKNSPGNMMKHGNCPKCSRKAKKTTEEYKLELLDINSMFIPIEDYAGSRTPIKHKCLICGYFKLMSPTNALRSNFCPSHELSNGFKRHRMVLGKRTIVYQGYNNRALSDMLKHGIKAKDILTEYEKGVPKITYKYKGVKKYYPDIYVANLNLIIEVKSPATMGLGIDPSYGRSASEWYKLVAKYRYCVKQGYRFKLMVYGSYPVKRLEFPKNWHTLTHREAVSLVKELCIK